MLEHEGTSVNGGSNGGTGAHVDEGTVHAWLDGQLSAGEAARIEAHVTGCRECSTVVAEARGHIAAATRILNSLDGVPGQVVPRSQRRPRRWQLRIAAAIVVMALGTAVVLRGSRGSLNSALERAAPVSDSLAHKVGKTSAAPQASALPLKAQSESGAAGKAIRPAPPARPSPMQPPLATPPAALGGNAGQQRTGAAREQASRAGALDTMRLMRRAPAPQGPGANGAIVYNDSTAATADANKPALEASRARATPMMPAGAAASSVRPSPAPGVSAQNAAAAPPVAVGSGQSAGAAGGGPQPRVSRCRDQIVRVLSATSGAASAESTEARLTVIPSQSLGQVGFVVLLVPDTATTPAGSWQPVGQDSALVGLQGPRGVTQSRVGCTAGR